MLGGGGRKKKADLEQIRACFEKCAKEMLWRNGISFVWRLFTVFGFQGEGPPPFSRVVLFIRKVGFSLSCIQEGNRME